LFERVPPVKYGGTERIVSYLTEELVRRGHEVTLYASGDSLTDARLVAGCKTGLRLEGRDWDHNALLFPMLERVCREAAGYDVIHYHTDFYHFPLCRRHDTPHVTTLHGRLDIPGLQELYEEYAEVPLVSISDAQRTPVPHAGWQTTIYHGMPLDAIPFQPEPEDYLVYLGRFSREKRADRAIEIGRLTGLPLKLLGKVDRADRVYFESEIEPLLDGDGVEFLGEPDEAAKLEALRNARALLFPIDWPEPFGMVLIEEGGRDTGRGVCPRLGARGAGRPAKRPDREQRAGGREGRRGAPDHRPGGRAAGVRGALLGRPHDR
jgi:glycosyltransferase involved in cell wall biosynthesis